MHAYASVKTLRSKYERKTYVHKRLNYIFISEKFSFTLKQILRLITERKAYTCSHHGWLPNLCDVEIITVSYIENIFIYICTYAYTYLIRENIYVCLSGCRNRI